MADLQRVYDASPLFVQNFMVTVKGALLLWERKSGGYQNYLREIEGRLGWSRERLDQYALSELRQVLRKASASNEYYRTLFSDIAFDPEACVSLDYFRRLPILDRKAVKADPGKFYSNRKEGHQVLLNTTGTTGSPLAIVADRVARQKNYAFFDSFLAIAGVRPADKHVVIGGRPIIPSRQEHGEFWRHSLIQRAMLMSSYHVTPKSIHSYLDAIVRYEPTYIESYPSALYLIARMALESNLEFRSPALRAIVTSSEKLHDYQKDLIESFFGVRVFDQYGNAEMCCLVHQCAEGRYHVRSDYGLLELLDDEGEPVPPGCVGDVVCTGFVNNQMPLIRYRIGDQAVWSVEGCSCGLQTPVIQEIMGRADDVLIGADGRVVGRMSPVLKGLPIFESQYVQHVRGEVIVRVVPAQDFLLGIHIPLIQRLVKARLGHDTEVEVVLVDALDYGSGQKLRNVISTLVTNRAVDGRGPA